MKQNYINIHFQYLLDYDPFFIQFWNELKRQQQKLFLQTCLSIENQVTESGHALDKLHTSAFDITKRWFIRVQEKEFEYSNIPASWANIIRNKDTKEQIYIHNLSVLKKSVTQLKINNDVCLYGGVKPDKSLDRKLFQRRIGNAVQTNLLDLWDVIRFRIVLRDLDDLLITSIQFWEYFFDNILRCRNYYYNPKNGHSGDPYRAIHFELSDVDHNLVEVQLMTSYREVVCFFDYAFLFKKFLPFRDLMHEKWLLNFSKKANVLNWKEANGPHS